MTSSFPATKRFLKRRGTSKNSSESSNRCCYLDRYIVIFVFVVATTIILVLFVHYVSATNDVLMLAWDGGGEVSKQGSVLFSTIVGRTNTTGMASTHEVPPSSSDGRSAVVVVAYAVSLIKCGDKKGNKVSGLQDSALVLAHAIHQISSRNPESKSKYDYELYAIVHRQAAQCSDALRRAGYKLVVVDPPIRAEEIQGESLRKNIHKEVCCGADEFVKLEAYNLPHDIIVHTDMDFVFFKPMDVLFDAMLYPHDSEVGRSARERIPLEFPEVQMPEKIEAFWTRDWPKVLPGRKAMYQAGFIVTRRDTTILPEAIAIVRKGDYVEGFSRDNGWGHLGYGGNIGSRAMQGLMAYFYDVVRPNTTVELNQCRFNHMGMQVLHRGKWCKNGRPSCEDCRRTPLDDIYSAHYTICRKPWQCVALGSRTGRLNGARYGNAIDTGVGSVEHCHLLTQRWHEIRHDLEEKLTSHTRDPTIQEGRKGSYMESLFYGHCSGEHGYLPIRATNQTLELVPEIHG